MTKLNANKMIKKYADVGSVCSDCAARAGFAPKDKVVGVWMDECEICHAKRPCTNLWHDWSIPSELIDASIRS